MKTKNQLAVLFVLLMFSACKKSEVKPTINSQTDFATITDQDAAGLYYNAETKTYKLVLQPGDDGQDAWIETIHPDANSGFIDQFKVLGWTDGFAFVTRSLIKFTGLSQIPTGSTVLSSKLFLYGLESSPIHLPQGNSYYPNSPYKPYGTNDVYVQKVTSDWDENSVTWNTQPSITPISESLISPSTTQWNYNPSADVSKIIRHDVKYPDKSFGFMLRLVNEAPYHSMGFCTSENVDAAKRPKLVVVYRK